MADTPDKTSVALLFSYLQQTNIAVLFVHLVWLAMVCCVLSMTYIVSFHTTDLITIYDHIYKVCKQ